LASSSLRVEPQGEEITLEQAERQQVTRAAQALNLAPSAASSPSLHSKPAVEPGCSIVCGDALS
jgi:hypothetical protein